MHELTFLKDLLIILSIAILVVIAFHRLRLPAIAGFILSGVIVGPQGLGLINDTHQVEILAEVGVALLLFGIGSELPLTKLRRLWRLAAIGGFLQVSVSAIVTFAICKTAGLPNNTSVVIGFIVALSSTAIVLRGLQQRGEIDAPHGRLIMGILVFQDFSVVPIMLVIPLLLGADLSAGAFAITLAKSVSIVMIVLFLAILIVPRILRLVARTRQRQLFILAVFVVCLGTAWLVTRSGASLAIGAFLAGLVVAGSEYRHQALADMLSFREVFASMFFVSIGMLLSPHAIAANLVPITGILLGILLGKSIIVFLVAWVMRMPLRVCLMTAGALAQVGEFSFILLYAIQGKGLIEVGLEGSLISAAILSMFITPFAMSLSPRLAVGLGKFPRIKSMMAGKSVEDVSEAVYTLDDHVIVAGYGFAGRELAHALDECHIPYIVVDVNFENISMALREKRRAVFGDITSEDVLQHVGIEKARELVLLINDPGAAGHAVRVARGLATHVHITVRTTYLLDIGALLVAGANEIIPAEREAAVQVVTQVLKRQKANVDDIARQVSEIRDHSEDNNS